MIRRQEKLREEKKDSQQGETDCDDYEKEHERGGK